MHSSGADTGLRSRFRKRDGNSYCWRLSRSANVFLRYHGQASQIRGCNIREFEKTFGYLLREREYRLRRVAIWCWRLEVPVHVGHIVRLGQPISINSVGVHDRSGK